MTTQCTSPLSGVTIAVTRAAEQAGGLSELLRAAGATVVEAPTLAIAEPADFSAVDTALHRLESYDWLVLTSANGVAGLFHRLEKLGIAKGELAEVRVAAIGSATRDRLADHGVRADLVPDEAVGEAMADALIAAGVAGRRVLLLRGDLARPVLADRLRAAGAICDDVIIYRTVCPAALPAGFVEMLGCGGIHWVALTSPSSLKNLLRLLGEPGPTLLSAVRLASIGPVTSAAIREAGLTVSVEADPHDAPGLVAAIIRAVK